MTRNAIALKKFLLFLIVILPWSNVLRADDLTRLRNLSIPEGLSNMNITDIAQDDLGYIWLATMRGLNRYNGHEFQQFFFEAEDSSSLNSNVLHNLHVTGTGQILVGSNKGINSIDTRTLELSNPFPDITYTVRNFAEWKGFTLAATPKGVLKLDFGNNTWHKMGGDITATVSFVVDSDEDLWLTFVNSPVIGKYDQTSDTFTPFRIPNRQGRTVNITSVYEAGSLFILSTTEGLYFMDKETGETVRPESFAPLTDYLEGKEVYFVLEKSPGIFWVSSLGTIIQFDTIRGVVTKSIFPSNTPTAQYMNYFIDREDNIWFGSFDHGVNIHFSRFALFNTDPTLNELLAGKFVTRITGDKTGNLVMGTRDNGFLIYDPRTKKHSAHMDKSLSVAHARIRDIFIDDRNRYWISNAVETTIFDPRTGSVRRLLDHFQPNDGVNAMLQRGERVFGGSSMRGLLVFDMDGKLSGQYTQYGKQIMDLAPLPDGKLLFTSYGEGLYQIDPQDMSVRQLVFEGREDDEGLRNLITVHISSDGALWLGTYNYGLYRVNAERTQIRNFSTRDGLPCNDIVGIEEDLYGQLWLSTAMGLVRLDIKTQSIRNVIMDEGPGNYQFHHNASYKGPDGTLYFGGNFGLSYFKPSSSEEHGFTRQMNVMIERVQVINKQEKKQLWLFGKNSIRLGHKERFISFDFVAFDYTSPNSVKYHYMMEGFDDTWYETAGRTVSFSNLPRGKYTFRVKAQSTFNMLSENETSLDVRVVPAPWFTAGAWTLYSIILLLILFYVIKLLLKNLEYQHKLEVEEYENARAQEINSMKQKFFSNIAHEFRTPLTLISSLTNRLWKSGLSPDKYKDTLTHIDFNVKRLLDLLNQLLTFRNIKSETLPLWLSRGAINGEIERLVNTFSVMADDKQIDISFVADNEYRLAFDSDKFEKIMGNLLTNAIKHTDSGGYIEVILRKIDLETAKANYPDLGGIEGEFVENYLEIDVSDSGSGIEAEHLKMIFERYGQAPLTGSGHPDYSGTGIGLHYTKSLVMLHKGAIRVRSVVKSGTTFSIVLPVEETLYKDFIYKNEAPPEATITVVENRLASYKQDKAETDEKEKRYSILLVEDDPSLNRLLCGLLSEKYDVVTAFDGQEGYDKLQHRVFDLVISDVMMPKLDGMELTRRIKNNRKYAFIPVILLTAKSEMPDYLEGMEVGADQYLTKPFKEDFLFKVVDNILENRKRIRAIFLNGLMPSLEKEELSQPNVQFISRLNEILETELSNPDLGISFIAEKMNMSRSSFYRSFEDLTDIAPNVYIRKFRINKAIEYMKQGGYTMKEIVDLIGFDSGSYFSTVFKAEKGVPPSEFLNSLKKQGNNK